MIPCCAQNCFTDTPLRSCSEIRARQAPSLGPIIFTTADFVMEPLCGLATRHGRGVHRTLTEIRREELRADLVVLSACETAVGKIEGEEGVANLARTFLIAGSRSIIASSWMVDDRATATLMAQIYSYLAKGEPVATALRRAQIDMLRQFGSNTSPFYWAAFLAIGDGNQKISFIKTNPAVEH